MSLGNFLGLIGGVATTALQSWKEEERQEQAYAYNQAAGQTSWARNLSFWNATAAPAQVNKLKEAGLNPALMYGTSGSGGGDSNGGTAGSQAAMQPQGLMMGLQARQMQAQIKLTEAQADKAQAEAINAGKEKTEAEIRNINASAENTEAMAELNRRTTRMQDTVEDNLKKVGQLTEKQIWNVHQDTDLKWTQMQREYLEFEKLKLEGQKLGKEIGWMDRVNSAQCKMMLSSASLNWMMGCKTREEINQVKKAVEHMTTENLYQEVMILLQIDGMKLNNKELEQKIRKLHAEMAWMPYDKFVEGLGAAAKLAGK